MSRSPTRVLSERFIRGATRRYRLVLCDPRRRPVNAVLWILQILLAAVFLAAGGLKLIRSKEELLPQMHALAPFRPLSVKAIGLAEVAGALGLVLPPLVGISDLVPWAALGIASVMVAGAMANAEQGFPKLVPVNAVLLVLAVVVMYGRSAHVPL